MAGDRIRESALTILGLNLRADYAFRVDADVAHVVDTFQSKP